MIRQVPPSGKVVKLQIFLHVNVSAIGWIRLQSFVSFRVAACKNQESADKSDFMDFFIFCPEKPFGELSSKITKKLSKEFSFLRNLAKREMSCSGTTRH